MRRRAHLAGLAGAAAVAAGSPGTALAAEPPAPPAPPAASQRLAVLLGDHGAWAVPDTTTPRLQYVLKRRPLTGVRTVLPVIGTTTVDGRRWLRVRLPGRPNGRTGWMLADRTRPASTEWHLRLRLSTRRLVVFRDGRVVRTFRAVIGKAATPTPRGEFFVEEAVAVSVRKPGGPFALAMSARSEVLQEFAGGPGQIAIHGTTGFADPLGSASSHGCVRVGAKAITWLARRIGGGVPVTVVR